jgi:hypothetical protein
MRTSVTVADHVPLAANERLQAAAGRGCHGPLGFDPLPHRGPVVTNVVIDEIREDEAD